jgi:hypothetical protein
LFKVEEKSLSSVFETINSNSLTLTSSSSASRLTSAKATEEAPARTVDLTESL